MQRITHWAQRTWQGIFATESRWADAIGARRDAHPQEPVYRDGTSDEEGGLQAINVTKAGPNDRQGDIKVDSNKSMQLYREWVAKTRPAPGPNGLRRPLWLTRPLKPHIDQFYLETERVVVKPVGAS